MTKNPCTMSAREAAQAISDKALSSVELVEAHLDRVEARENDVGAWAYIDPDQVLDEARQRDQQPGKGPLHGVPVGIKDVIDTSDMPTEYGSAIYAGHRPTREAACVSLIRRAGGVIMGKTVSTEFALYSPGKTKNPHNANHTPGGSSSGSAAAVADFHVPVAMGTQTSGSIIRPAAYCGVIGYKPTFNTIAIDGVKPLAASLDTLGYLVRTIDDITLMREVFLGKCTATPHPTNSLRVGICHTPSWSEAEHDTQAMFEQVSRRLTDDGITLEQVSLPEIFNDLGEVHANLMAYEVARNYVTEYKPDNRLSLSPKAVELIEQGWQIPTDEYYRLRAAVRDARTQYASLIAQYDALMVPAATGSAPDIATTGNPVFCRLWSLLGVPAVSMPAGRSDSGLPVGVQFVGAWDGDTALLNACGRIETLLQGRAPSITL